MQITIKGKQLELPPNCPIIWDKRLGFSMELSPTQAWHLPDAIVIPALETYWRREAERLGPPWHGDARCDVEAQAMAALKHAEAFAAIHRSILEEQRNAKSSSSGV